jgi:RNA polymerase sigma factor (sigma-70 family)
MTPDSELLRRYAGTKSEEAFAELVQRHVNLVYSAALRQVNGDAHLAQDVAQTVFTDLARKAASLARRAVLTGWLYTSAHFAAAKAVRTEQRRHAREQEAHTMRETIHTPASEPDWEKLRPVLDEVMHKLKEADREAILLRYFENRPFAEIGEKFGLNENAARMRVERALKKLRDFLAKRSITTATALASVISANAVQIAPAGLATTLTTASLAGAGTGTLTLLKFMTMTKLKLGISALVVAGATTALVVQHQTQQKLRAENDSLTQQLAQLKTDNESLSNRLAAAGNSQSLSDEQLNELLQLRGEVGMLRQQTNELGSFLRGNPLRPNLSPHAPIPQDPNVAARFSLHTMNMAGAAKQMVFVFGIYAQGHNGQYPTNFDQLEGDKYFPTNFPDTDGMKIGFDNFEFVNAGLVSGNTPDKIMLREKIPRQGPDGNWVRVYGMADGSVQVHVSDDGNFDDYEKNRMASPPSQ